VLLYRCIIKRNAKGYWVQCALPALEAAVAALNTIKPADIVSSLPSRTHLLPSRLCWKQFMLDVKPAQCWDPDVPGKKHQDYWPSSKTLHTKFVERLAL
jgi:dynein heavy chain